MNFFMPELTRPHPTNLIPTGQAWPRLFVRLTRIRGYTNYPTRPDSTRPDLTNTDKNSRIESGDNTLAFI